MNHEKDQDGDHVFQAECPSCHALLWVDPQSQAVIRFEKAKKPKESLDELLKREKKKKDEFDRKFEATAEMEKERWKKAQEKFKQALSDLDRPKEEE